ncbi:hypothetical protein ES708_25085 [subsurface metagenome]
MLETYRIRVRVQVRVVRWVRWGMRCRGALVEIEVVEEVGRTRIDE